MLIVQKSICSVFIAKSVSLEIVVSVFSPLLAPRLNLIVRRTYDRPDQPKVIIDFNAKTRKIYLLNPYFISLLTLLTRPNPK